MPRVNGKEFPYTAAGEKAAAAARKRKPAGPNAKANPMAKGRAMGQRAMEKRKR